MKTSFRRKPESSKFNYFWMPDQVRHDGFGTFYEIVKIRKGKKDLEGSGRDITYRKYQRCCSMHIKINMERVELRLWIVYEKLSPLRAITKRQPAWFF